MNREARNILVKVGAAFACVAVGGLIAVLSLSSLFASEPYRFQVQDLPIVGMVTTAAFSPDGKYIAAGTENGEFWTGTLKVWRVTDGKEIFSHEFSQWIKKLVFSNDGQFLAVASSTRSYWWRTNPRAHNFEPRSAIVTVFNFPKMTIAKELAFEDIVETICMSPDGTKISVARSHNLGSESVMEDQELEIVNWRSGIKVRLDSPKMDFRTGQDLAPMAFSHDGRRFFVISRGQTYDHFDVATGRYEGVLPDEKLVVGPFLTSPGDQGDFWMRGREATGHRSADHSRIGIREFTDKTNAHRTFVDSISGDRKRILGVRSFSDGRDRVIWEDLNEKKTTEAFVPFEREARVSLCHFNPADPDVFVVGLRRSCTSSLLDPGFPRPERGPLLLFRLKK